MCDKAVDTHPSTIKYVPEFCNTQELCYKAVHWCFFLYLIIFLIKKKLKKYVTLQFLYIQLLQLNDIKTP